MQFSPKPCPPKLSAFSRRMFVEVIVCKHFSFTTCPFDKDSQETFKTLLSRATPFCQGSSFCQRPTLLPRVWNFVKLWKPFCQGPHPLVKGHLFVKRPTLLSRVWNAGSFGQGHPPFVKGHLFVKDQLFCQECWSVGSFCQGQHPFVKGAKAQILLSRSKAKSLLSRARTFCQGSSW